MISFKMFIVLLIGVFALDIALGVKTSNVSRKNKRNLSMFNVIRFKNEACEGTGGRNGTCYTSQECEDKNGENAGSCAGNFGVCCTFSVGCGSHFTENCTYFEASNPDTGPCEAKLCTGREICQIRLDFISFVITGPNTNTVATTSLLRGDQIPPSATKDSPASQHTQCSTDTFTATSPRVWPSALQICGTNSGEHMYVDSDPDCNTFRFNLQSAEKSIGAAVPANRHWNIKISYYSCQYNNLAPDSCTQYFWGAENQAVRSFNYASGLHLASQRQHICVRRERGVCSLCWTPTTDIDFQISGSSSAASLYSSTCCGYGFSGTGSSGADCLKIHGYLESKNGNDFGEGNSFCGRKLASGTLCQINNSFSITFVSDPWEYTQESEAPSNKGFELTYIQRNC